MPSQRISVTELRFEECQNLDQATRRERSLKNGGTRRKAITRLIEDFDPPHLAPFA